MLVHQSPQAGIPIKFISIFFLFFFFILLFYFLTLQYCIGFAIYQHESNSLPRMSRGCKTGTLEILHRAEKDPEYMDRYSIAMQILKMAIPWNAYSI